MRCNIKFRILIVILFACFTFHIYALETVQHIDLNRYLGKWYEIARFDSWFEKDCTNVTAEYSTSSDGKINVLNTCYLHTPKGKRKQAVGRAIVADKKTNSKLRVSFLPRYLSWFDRVFSGDYWILKIDPEYSVVLVGDPSKKYLWILSRDPNLDSSIYNAYVSAAKNLGFNVHKLHKTVIE